MIIKKIFLKFIKKINKLYYAKLIGVNLGENVRLIGDINFGTEPYLVTLGNNVTVSYDVSFITHDGATYVFRNNEKYKNIVKYGKINIGNNCFVGAKSILLPGAGIGNNSIIAAGSVVTKKFPDNVVVGGNPAKIIKTTEEYIHKCEKENINYDVGAYKKNKKLEILRMLK